MVAISKINNNENEKKMNFLGKKKHWHLKIKTRERLSLYLFSLKSFISLSTKFNFQLKLEKWWSKTKNSKYYKILFDRTMEVKKGNNYSQSQYIPCAVPRWSALALLLFLKSINDLPNDIKSKLRLLVRPFSKETMPMDLNKFSDWKDIWKLRFYIEKCQVLYIRSKKVKVEYELANKEIKKVNEKCDLRVGFDQTIKVENHILSIVLEG